MLCRIPAPPQLLLSVFHRILSYLSSQDRNTHHIHCYITGQEIRRVPSEGLEGVVTKRGRREDQKDLHGSRGHRRSRVDYPTSSHPIIFGLSNWFAHFSRVTTGRFSVLSGWSLTITRRLTFTYQRRVMASISSNKYLTWAPHREHATSTKEGLHQKDRPCNGKI